ncbi:MAG: hypothetical protein KAJ42_12080 [Gemmatimonadetes bacterium]|nr:hypothetical protein [Gemmatimonadota bacterium]
MKRFNREISVFNMSMLDVITGALGAFLMIMIILLPHYKRDTSELLAEIRDQEARIAALESDASAAQLALADARAEVTEAENRAEAAEERAEAAAAEREAEQAARAEAERRADAADAELAEAERRADAADAELAVAERRARESEAESDRLRARLDKTFLVVLTQWQTDAQDVDMHVVDPSGAHFYFGRRTVDGRRGELSEDQTDGPGIEVWQIEEADPGEYRVYVKLYSRAGNPANPSVRGRVYFRDGRGELRDMVLRVEDQDVETSGLAVEQLMATITVGADGSVSIR